MISPIELVKQAKLGINECDNADLFSAIEQQKLIIDVREPEEFASGCIPSAINVPRGILEFSVLSDPRIKTKLNQQAPELTEIYLYCKGGGRSALAAQSLHLMGFKKIYSLQQGIDGWSVKI